MAACLLTLVCSLIALLTCSAQQDVLCSKYSYTVKKEAVTDTTKDIFNKFVTTIKREDESDVKPSSALQYNADAKTVAIENVACEVKVNLASGVLQGLFYVAIAIFFISLGALGFIGFKLYKMYNIQSQSPVIEPVMEPVAPAPVMEPVMQPAPVPVIVAPAPVAPVAPAPVFAPAALAPAFAAMPAAPVNVQMAPPPAAPVNVQMAPLPAAPVFAPAPAAMPAAPVNVQVAPMAPAAMPAAPVSA